MTDPAIRVDALLPAEVARKAEEVGTAKARLDAVSILILGFLAGAFISLGGIFSTTVIAGAGDALPYGVTRILAGLAFCLGLILVVMAGAELFTGNNLIVIAWASGKVSTRALIRNWALVYAGNLAGSLATALLMFLTGQYAFGGGAVGKTILSIASAKVSLGFTQAVALGMMCNALVCLAVWLTLGARTTTDKILAILFPITAFVAAGFEHSVANMYFIPVALLVKQFDPAFVASLGVNTSGLTVGGFLDNLIPVTIGNIIGGGLMVAAVYWFVYIRRQRRAA
ncbi:MAG: formate/nitrite transporter family protein [Anaerolineae bacterium]|nr:formate/nitrite transporter family protein [Anaerolineae bacterium]